MARAEAAAQIAAAKKEEEERAAAQAAAEAKAKAEAKKTYTAEAVARDLKGRVVKKAEPKQQPQTRQTDNKRGNGANCKGNPPQCNWWDAKAYCGGRLPSVAQLTAWYNSECADGRKGSIYCDSGWVWSGEETSASNARVVDFYDGSVDGYHKDDNNVVRCR